MRIDAPSIVGNIFQLSDDAILYNSLTVYKDSILPYLDRVEIARGTLDDPAIILEDTKLYSFGIAGFDGASFINAARMDIIAGPPASGDISGRWEFYVSLPGSGTDSLELIIGPERVTVANALTIGTTDVTAFGVSLIGAANATAAATVPEMTIAPLFDLITQTSGYIPVFTGPGGLTSISSSTFGQGLLSLADAAALQALVDLVVGVDVQAYHANLTAFAGLSLVADRLPYANGTGTLALATFTAAGRALIDDADASAQRTTLGLAIGTDVQAYNVNLAALAGLTSAANKLPYFTGSGTAGVVDLTATAITLLDDTSTSAMRTTLGLAIGTNVQAYDADLDALASAGSTGSGAFVRANGPTFTNSFVQTKDGGGALNNAFTEYGSYIFEDYNIANGSLASPTSPSNSLLYAMRINAWDGSAFSMVGFLSAETIGAFSTYWAGCVTIGVPSAAGTVYELKVFEDRVEVAGNLKIGSTTSTATGLSIFGAANSAAVRTAAGVVIGTNVQAWDTDLDALAGLTYAADTIPYFTGAHAAATPLTAAGRALIDDADASAQRTTLGLAIGTDVQAYHANLGAFAGLSLLADRLPYANGTGTLALATFTSFGRSLVDDADATAGRSTLGVVIGTNVQAFHANLTAFAGLSLVADRLPYANGTGTLALATFTSFGRSLVDDADATAAKTTLGLVIGTNVQAWDTDLDALAGLTYAADTIAYFTGAHAAATTTLSSYGRTLIDDADATTARSTLGLVIGTNVQAYDAELAAIAGLTSAADRLPYFTGSGTAALATFTSFARTLVDDTTQAAMQTTLGLTYAGLLELLSPTAGNVPLFNGTNSMTVTATTAGGRAVMNITGVTDTVPVFTSSSAVTTQSFKQGTYTPTITGILNVTSATAYTVDYSVEGNEITVNVYFDVTLTAGFTLTSLSITLPVSSDIQQVYQLVGLGMSTTGYVGTILGNTSTDLAEITLPQGLAGAITVVGSFRYRKI